MECTKLRGERDVGQFEKVVIVPVCTSRSASFLVLDAIAKTWTAERPLIFTVNLRLVLLKDINLYVEVTGKGTMKQYLLGGTRTQSSQSFSSQVEHYRHRHKAEGFGAHWHKCARYIWIW